MALPPPAIARIAALAGRRGIRRALDWVARSEQELAGETIRLTEIPAPTFQEQERCAYVAERLHGLGLRAVELTPDGNVYALCGDGPPQDARLAVLAHVDTVFREDVPVTVTSRDGRLFGPGVGDNGAGVSGLICALEAMQRAELEPDRPVWIVATVGEEGLGNLRGANAAMDRLTGTGIEAVVAVEGSFYGRVSHVAVGSRRLRVRFSAEGGHSWHDFGRPSAVHEMMRAAAEILAIDVSGEPRTTLNIGEVHGGTGVNVIAECAEMVLDMRSVDAARLDAVDAAVRSVFDRARRAGTRLAVEAVGARPAGSIPVTHPLVQTCTAILAQLGTAPQYAAASTDANAAIGRGVPAVTLGVTRGGGAHSLAEWIEVAPMVRGVQQLVLAICALSELPAVGPERLDW